MGYCISTIGDSAKMPKLLSLRWLHLLKVFETKKVASLKCSSGLWKLLHTTKHCLFLIVVRELALRCLWGVKSMYFSTTYSFDEVITIDYSEHMVLLQPCNSSYKFPAFFKKSNYPSVLDVPSIQNEWLDLLHVVLRKKVAEKQ